MGIGCRGVAFKRRMLRGSATDLSSSYVRIDDEFSHHRRTPAVRDVGKNLMEVFNLLASPFILHHPSILPQHTESKRRVHHRQHDEGRLYVCLSVCLSVCVSVCLSFCMSGAFPVAGGSCLKSPNNSRWMPKSPSGSPLPRATPPLLAPSASDRTWSTLTKTSRSIILTCARKSPKPNPKPSDTRATTHTNVAHAWPRPKRGPSCPKFASPYQLIWRNPNYSCNLRQGQTCCVGSRQKRRWTRSLCSRLPVNITHTPTRLHISDVHACYLKGHTVARGATNPTKAQNNSRGCCGFAVETIDDAPKEQSRQ
jgi:hypothetical protein